MNSRKAVILFDENVKNAGRVINIIICGESGMPGFRLPENEMLWDCGSFDAGIGDIWNDGVFIHPDGSRAEIIESDEAREIRSLKKSNDTLKMQNADIAEAILQMEMEKGGTGI